MKILRCIGTIILLLVLVLIASSCKGNSGTADGSDIIGGTNDSEALAEQLDIGGKTLYGIQRGCFFDDSDIDDVVLVCGEEDEGSGETSISIIANAGGKRISADVGTYAYFASNWCSLVTYDIDGDDIDEIVLNMMITGNWNSITLVYKVEDGELKLFQDLQAGVSDYPNPLGFSSTLTSDGKLVVENPDIGFECVVMEHCEIDLLIGFEYVDGCSAFRSGRDAKLCCSLLMTAGNGCVGKLFVVYGFDKQTQSMVIEDATFLAN